MGKSKLDHHHSSDLCWRYYHSFRIKAAASHDLIKWDSQLKNICYAEAANRIEILYMVNIICIQLENCAINIHPNYFKDKDLVKRVASQLEEISKNLPTAGYELSKYFSMDNLNFYKVSLINAYKNSPELPRLSYDVFSKLGILPEKLCYLPDHIGWSKKWETIPHVFSQVHDMAIGHFSIYLESQDFKKVLKNNRYPNYIISSGYGIGESFKKQFIRNSTNIIVENNNELNKFTLEWWANSYSCDPRTWWYSKKTRLHVAQAIMTKSEASIKGDMVIMHLRTNNYKQSDSDPLQKIRSVEPKTYINLVARLVKNGYKVIHVTADKKPYLFDECDNLLINSSAQEKQQWDVYKNAAFVVGTPSGMAELRSLCSYNALLTNYINVPEAMISHYGILAMKRFKININKKIKNATYFLRLFYDHWLLPSSDCLSNYCEIRPLSNQELTSAGEQYLDLIEQGSHKHTLYNAFKHKDINIDDLYMYPDINLSIETYSDIKAILNDY